jgi:hypothetical protein
MYTFEIPRGCLFPRLLIRKREALKMASLKSGPWMTA